MDDLSTLTTFLGWCSVINMGILAFVAVILTTFRGAVENIHTRVSGLDKENLDIQYFNFLGNYKVAVLVLNVVPYFALKVMA